jgi:GT2 family glycosyltransferase
MCLTTTNVQHLDRAAEVVPEVTIVIVNWNTCHLLHGCLESIKSETSASYEIIVVDNASSDDSCKMIQTAFPEVKLIANNTNRGFSAANNQALAISKGRYVLLLNPDTIVLDGAIDKMLTWLATRPDVGCAGCQVLDRPGVIQRTCFADHTPMNLFISGSGLMRLTRWFPSFGRHLYLDWDCNSERNVDVVTGMFMLVPRQVLDMVGMLDETFFVYAEEADWCRRIREAGWRCAFTPVAQIIHLDGGGKSTSQIRSKMHVQLYKSLLIYVRKYDGYFGYASLIVIFFALALLKNIIFRSICLVHSGKQARAEVRLSNALLRYLSTGREPLQ